ncbi:hypothetical protein [Salinivibrio sp. HTSP]|uniref:hypothetical protein n=1 Tax=Salinivibrio sp. HTSP TaxID=2115977 RepID=UPI000E311302|nr:hypothetical protein [Salinivibrio sp. HTSP]
MIKPTVLIVFILGIAGYNLLRNIHKTHYVLKRSNGYHTFFSSSSAGIILFVIATLLYFWLIKLGYNYNPDNSLGKSLLETTFSQEFTPEFISLIEISALTLLLSQAIPWFFYLPLDKKEMLRREFLRDAESPEFTRLFYQSSLTGIPVLFTLSDRKVYIGYIYEIQVKQFTDIYILPLFSGYRCQNELKLKKVTPYKSVVDLLETKEIERKKNVLSRAGYYEEDINEYVNDYLDQRNIWADFIIALPLREIVHAHLHDFAHENMFRELEVNHKWKELGSFRFSGSSENIFKMK